MTTQCPLCKGEGSIKTKPKTGEPLPPIFYANAWRELYNCFGERMQQDEMDLMDSVLQGVVANMEDDVRANIRELIRRFPHFLCRRRRKVSV